MGEDAKALIRDLYTTWNRDGVEAFRAYASPNVVWRDDPRLPDPVTAEGLDAVISRFQDYIDVVGLFQLKPLEIAEVGDGRLYSVVTVTVRGEGSGATVSDDHLHIVRVADGRIAELWQRLDVGQAKRELGIAQS
jgi:ketosteroid isomerase-like protein